MDDDKNQNIDAVIRKIQKLLSRTKENRGATDEESDTAMKIVQGLMAKYNLDMATVDAAGSSPDDTGSVRVEEKSVLRVRFKWQRELAKYVAEANFCLHLIRMERRLDEQDRAIWSADGRRVYRAVHRFIGRKANVITTQLMFDYLCHAVEDNVPIADRAERFSRASSSWKEGCAAKLCERLALRRADLMAEHDARVKADEDRIKATQAEAAKKRLQKQLAGREPTTAEIAAEMKRGARVATGRSAKPQDESGRPEVIKDDWKPGDGAEEFEAEVAAPSTFLVLSSVYDTRENEANWEMAHGYEPGYLARRRAEREASEREDEQQRIIDEAEGESEEVDAAEPVKETIETPRQRERREARETREHEADRRRWARENNRAWRREMKEHAKRDHGAYRAGMKTGDKIGLDPQVKARTSAKRLDK